jgi:anti-anti-sigma factor
MALLTTRKGELLIVALAGNLNGIVCEVAEREFEAAIDGTEKYVLFDLTELDFLGSAGVRLFILWAKQLKAKGAIVHYSNMNESVKGVFTISGLIVRMKTFATFEEALKAFPKK